MNRNVWLRLDNSRGRKPFCQITLKNTPEVAGANGLADALIRLDFISALADQRRFRLVNDFNDATIKMERLVKIKSSHSTFVFAFQLCDQSDAHIVRP